MLDPDGRSIAAGRWSREEVRAAMRQYHVYIMASLSRTLYTGVTNNLRRRVYEHRNGLGGGFTSRYNINRLVHAEAFGDVRDAIAREKQIKGWVRRKKLALVESANPEWEDLGEAWFAGGEDPSLRSG